MLKKFVLTTVVMILSAAAYAGDAKKPFEGLWMDDGGPTIIKEFSGFATYSGSDKNSSWSGKCIKVKEMYQCTGNGYDQAGKPFVETALFKLAPDGITSDFELIMADGKKFKDSVLLKRVK